MITTRRKLLKTAAAASLALATATAFAQDFPSRTIRILTPYAPGSTVDITSRMVAEGLSRKLGQTVIVENKSGGEGMIAMSALLSAPADGYTLLTDTPASAINPSLYPGRYDPVADLAPVAQLMSLPFVLAVAPSVPAKTVKDLVALAKAKPDLLNAAVAGTSTRLAGELFSMQSGAKFTPIPYRGAAPAIQAVLKNEARVVFLDAANLAPYITNGQMRGLMITGDKRWPALGDVPTAKEAGYPEYDISTWFGMFARSGTPPAVVDKLNQAIREVMASPEMAQYLEPRGATPSKRTADEFTRHFHREIALWRDVITKAGIKVQ
jgi:tripartite-type tricarboxylate transporter receptor subunit TctC